MVEVIPAILAPTLSEVESSLALVRGIAKTVQLDVCDGTFVPARTWPMHEPDKSEFEAMVRGESHLPFSNEFSFEVDLMVVHPEEELPKWAALGVRRAVFHLDAPHDFEVLHTNAEKTDIALGVAILPGTQVSRLESYMPYIAYVQVMGIEKVGAQGQPFSQAALATISELKAAYPDVTIQVDGGVSDISAPLLRAAGVDRLVSGSYVLHATDPKNAVETLTHG